MDDEVSGQGRLRASVIAMKKKLHAFEESLKIIETKPKVRSDGVLAWKRLRFNPDKNHPDIVSVCNVFANGAAGTNEVHCLPDRNLWPFEYWTQNGQIRIKFPTNPTEYIIQQKGNGYGLFDTKGTQMHMVILDPISHVVVDMIPFPQENRQQKLEERASSLWAVVVSMFELMTGNSSTDP